MPFARFCDDAELDLFQEFNYYICVHCWEYSKPQYKPYLLLDGMPAIDAHISPIECNNAYD